MGLTFILAAARTAVEAMDSTFDMEDSVLRLSAMAACSPREAAVLIARGRVPKEDTCARSARNHLSIPLQLLCSLLMTREAAVSRALSTDANRTVCYDPGCHRTG